MSELGSGSGSSYPTALDTDNSTEVNSPSAGKTKARAETINDANAAIVAIETELGTDPAGSLTDVKTFLQTEHGTDGTHNNATYRNFNVAIFSRSIFAWKDADEILIGGGSYWCKDKVCWWDAQLTSDIGSPDANDWYYLYLDYSAITSGTEITTTELIWANTAPAYSHVYRGWYNSDDRCIFAVRTDGSSNILEFFHDGDLILFADELATNIAATNIPSASWTDVAYAAGDTRLNPAFSVRAEMAVQWVYVDQDSTLLWRTNGQSGTTGHRLTRVTNGAVPGNKYGVATVTIMTDSSGIIELQESSASTNTASAWIAGWHLPVGI